MYNFNSSKKRIDWLYNEYVNKDNCSINDFIKIVNAVYYKHSVNLYQSRYIEDIKLEYKKIFKEINFNNVNIINIGGGTGFEFEQFMENNINFSSYNYIEPDTSMADKFKNKSIVKNANIKIFNNLFEEVYQEFTLLPNKVFVMNSCFHHLIFVKEFLDLIKKNMNNNDMFIIAHEPENNYNTSLLKYLNYFIRVLFTDIVFRKLNIIKNKTINSDKERWKKINDELLRKGIIVKKLKPLIIRRIIDYGVNTKGDWKFINVPDEYNEGHWTKDDILRYMGNGYKIEFYSTYRHFGDSKNNIIIKLLNKLFSTFFNKHGSNFSMVIKKDDI